MSPEVTSVLDAFADFLVVIGPTGAIAATNRAFSRRFQPPGVELVGRNLRELVETPPEALAGYLRLWSGSRSATPGKLTLRLATGGSLECRCDGSALRPAGDIGPSMILLRCRPKPDAAGQFTALNQKIAELTREVVARRRAEAQLHSLNDKLEQRVEERGRAYGATVAELDASERHFRHLVEGVTDYAIFMLDPQGFVTTWNPGARRIKGYEAGEIIGQHFSRFYTAEDLANDVPRQALATARHEGRFVAEGWRVRKGGTLFWASVVIDAINEDGKLIGFAKVTRDLTERRATEERLRHLQKMEAVGQLTGGLAHDFNNMLTVIGGNIETLQRQLDPTDTGRHRFADAALRGVWRAATLTSRLLAFSRRQPLDPKPTEVSRLIIGMSDLVVRTLGEHITVETVLSGGLWQVSIDPNQLESAVLNLAVNARDAMAQGGKLTIETANTHLDEAYAQANDEVRPGQYVMLAVSDTGTGMTPEIVERAFEPFFTTKGIGEGTGLGLSQVYGFIKQSGGHVKIYSEPGEGTTVRLYLPRLTASTAPAPEPAVPTVVAPGRRSETILVVEDDDDVRAYSVGVLREMGYTVLEATDGDSGLAALATHPEIILLFTDIGLPGPLNGRQLADETHKLRPNLKVLFTTGYARNAIVHQGRLDPDVQLIVKPFTYSSLAAKVRQVLDGEG